MKLSLVGIVKLARGIARGDYDAVELLALFVGIAASILAGRKAARAATKRFAIGSSIPTIATTPSTATRATTKRFTIGPKSVAAIGLITGAIIGGIIATAIAIATIIMKKRDFALSSLVIGAVAGAVAAGGAAGYEAAKEEYKQPKELL